MIDEEIGMPARRELSMRQLRHLLRLHHDGVSAREIGRRLGVARSTIQDNLKRAAAAGLAWPLGEDVTEEALERQLFGRAGIATGQRRRIEPDWAELARELKRPGVTMTILWEEYREIHPEGYGYSRFCDLLRGFERRLTPVMRQHHVAGEKAFVDYSGKRIGIADPLSGEIREAEISSACSAPRTSPMPRRLGRNSCRTGSAPMCVCSVFSAARQSFWFPYRDQGAVADIDCVISQKSARDQRCGSNRLHDIDSPGETMAGESTSPPWRRPIHDDAAERMELGKGKLREYVPGLVQGRRRYLNE
jgi:hypothetical protein